MLLHECKYIQGILKKILCFNSPHEQNIEEEILLSFQIFNSTILILNFRRKQNLNILIGKLTTFLTPQNFLNTHYTLLPNDTLSAG